jgi:aminoglycoside phosphotransferase (APT) family kinase protein
MRTGKMHADEVDTDVALVRRMLEAQFPQWAALTIRPVPSWGTDNALYRLGDDMVARLPRRKRTAGTLEKERRWLPRVAPLLPLAVPMPLADGMPAEGYPFQWHVYRWLKGEDATVQRVTDASPARDRSGAVRGRLAADRSSRRAVPRRAQLLPR